MLYGKDGPDSVENIRDVIATWLIYAAILLGLLLMSKLGVFAPEQFADAPAPIYAAEAQADDGRAVARRAERRGKDTLGRRDTSRF